MEEISIAFQAIFFPPLVLKMDLSDPVYSYLDENWPTEVDKLAD